MNKKSIQNQKHITMEEFLRNYCEITNEYVIDMLKDLSHHELKEVCNAVYKISLTRLPFEKVFQEDVNRGEVLLVVDSFSNSAPYKNPQAGLQDIINNPTSSTTNIEKEEIYEDTIDLIEDNLTLENVDISSIGSFDVPKVKTKGGK